jgi:Flp pilus assembly protein TadG
MAMPMLAQSLPVPAGGMLDGRRPRSRRARRWISVRLLACRAGNVVVEFALAAPVLMMLMLASAELARFVILHQKMDRVATTVSDLVSRAETINETEMADIFEAIGEVAIPFISPTSAW